MRRGKKREESKVPSPCIKVCSYANEPGAMYCVGCKRTSVEIREWIILTDEEKLNILKRISDGLY
jgi:predicted Fe-S protein YdhL (DUF1289 family)|tara:strand:- start:1757 stop:1951 length:195 start_codon:yes stop_codon:yes gene_type:complete